MKEYIEKHGLLLRIALIEHNPAKIQLTNEERMKFVKLIEEQPTADVVKKERYDRLLENSTIIADALRKYQSTDTVERKRGKWIPHNPDEKGFANHFQCSECSVWQKMEVPHKTHDFNFCPNCGSDNREETGDEEE